ncbi:pyruvate ferredoxin/flavodoxin oxidoreductase [Lucifera butyrica]|uniref:Pyruvate ferredoxin/flavodoxin oxidoreductase n=1 Tax=Lucifera butyrica TaxID=1351585 RepID=A0A498R954_9FIRM|nr:indolepyruvate oxidoreductase subunit beta [Lucifera butyrica]VBB07911.1 pyruvate ferredoxin/flavodoxin oxidoreductase [Lucifera butyrica]
MNHAAANVLIVGVGGQGTLLASKILGLAAQLSGLDVKQSEVHGMAQRGGSVVTYVRFAAKVYSPLVEKGQADMILAFEKLEALRWANYLKIGGTLIVNEQEILPMPVITGEAKYPGQIFEKLARQDIRVIPVQAVRLAGEIGELRATNVILLGVAARLLGFKQEVWQQAIEEAVPAKALPVNLGAFTRGWNLQAV